MQIDLVRSKLTCFECVSVKERESEAKDWVREKEKKLTQSDREKENRQHRESVCVIEKRERERKRANNIKRESVWVRSKIEREWKRDRQMEEKRKSDTQFSFSSSDMHKAPISSFLTVWVL